MVGTSGSAAARFAEKQASARNLPALICALARRDRGDQHLRVVAEHRGQRRPAAVGRQMAHLDAGGLHEQRGRQMQRAVEAGRDEDDLVRDSSWRRRRTPSASCRAAGR